MQQLQTLCILFVLIVGLSGCTEDPITPTGNVRITGEVYDQATSVPIADARVTILNTSEFTRTDSVGEFVFDSLTFRETYSLDVEAEGYLDESILVSFELNGTSNREVEIPLEEDITFNALPSVPELVFPVTDATGVPVEVTLRWRNNTDAADEDLRYTVTLASANQDLEFIAETSDTFLVVDDLEYGTTYFWQITADDQANQPVTSSLQRFRTGPFPDYRIHFVRRNTSTGNLVIFAGERPDLETGFTPDSLAAVALTDSSLNCWRPKLNLAANRIAYLSFVGTDIHIFTMNRDGTNPQQVTSTRPVSSFNALEINYAWSPNGGQFIYPHKDKLYIINENGTGLREFATADLGYFFAEVDWSGQGFIAARMQRADRYQSKILLFRENGTLLDTLVDGEVRQRWIGGLSLSEGGEFALFSEDRNSEQFTDELPRRAQVFQTSLNSGITTVNNEDIPANTNDLYPIAPPGGELVMFVNRPSDNSSLGSVYIMEINANTQNQSRRLVFPNATMPDWR